MYKQTIRKLREGKDIEKTTHLDLPVSRRIHLKGSKMHIIHKKTGLNDINDLLGREIEKEKKKGTKRK